MRIFSRRSLLRASLGVPVLAQGLRLRADATPSLVDVELVASQAWVTVGGRKAFLYAYNSQVPGPTLEARPGDTLRLRFTNNLPEETNLHFHGLHVQPTGNADNGFLMIPPGESFTYQLPIPSNHPAGTFWVHPHVHGKAASQVSRGLALPLLIRGDLDQISPIDQAPEYVVVLQDFALDAAGYPQQPADAVLMQGREGSLITAGGRVNPSIPIAAGGFVRLHLLNASSSRFYLVQLENHTLIQIASSGGALPATRVLDALPLAPGERAQVMVYGSQLAGIYRLFDL